jgi:transcriptional regulator with XRE-family HTH domain
MSVTISEKIGKRVREVRTSLELTQQDVAEKSGLGLNTVSRIERGQQGVNFENIARIANSLDIPFRDFCDIESETPEVRKQGQLQSLIEMLEDAPPAKVALIYELVEAVYDWDADAEIAQS